MLPSTEHENAYVCPQKLKTISDVNFGHFSGFPFFTAILLWTSKAHKEQTSASVCQTDTTFQICVKCHCVSCFSGHTNTILSHLVAENEILTHFDVFLMIMMHNALKMQWNQACICQLKHNHREKVWFAFVGNLMILMMISYCHLKWNKDKNNIG